MRAGSEMFNLFTCQAATAVGSLLAAAGMGLFSQVRRAGLWILTGIGVYGVCTVLFASSRTFRRLFQ